MRASLSMEKRETAGRCPHMAQWPQAVHQKIRLWGKTFVLLGNREKQWEHWVLGASAHGPGLSSITVPHSRILSYYREGGSTPLSCLLLTQGPHPAHSLWGEITIDPGSKPEQHLSPAPKTEECHVELLQVPGCYAQELNPWEGSGRGVRRQVSRPLSKHPFCSVCPPHVRWKDCLQPDLAEGTTFQRSVVPEGSD